MTRNATVLLAHEGVDVYAAYARTLRAAELALAPPLRRADQLEEALKSAPPLAVLVDLDTARYEGRRLVQRIRAVASAPIILAGRVTELGPEPILDALAAGAADFIEKDLDAPEDETGLDPQRLKDAVRSGPRPPVSSPAGSLAQPESTVACDAEQEFARLGYGVDAAHHEDRAAAAGAVDRHRQRVGDGAALLDDRARVHEGAADGGRVRRAR